MAECSAIGSASGSGPEGYRFKPGHSDILKFFSLPLLFVFAFSQENHIFLTGISQSFALEPPQNFNQKYVSLAPLFGYRYIAFEKYTYNFYYSLSLGMQASSIAWRITGIVSSFIGKDTSFVVIPPSDSTPKKSKYTILYFDVPLLFFAGYVLPNENPISGFLGFKYQRLIQGYQKTVYSNAYKIKYYNNTPLNNDIFSITGGFSYLFMEISGSWNIIPIFKNAPTLPTSSLIISIIIKGYKKGKREKG